MQDGFAFTSLLSYNIGKGSKEKEKNTSFKQVCVGQRINKGIGDAGSTADLRMLWSAIVCLGLGLLKSALDFVCYRCKPLDFVLRALRALRPVGLL